MESGVLLVHTMERCLSKLRAIERAVLVVHFGVGLSLQEIAKLTGVSQRTISRTCGHGLLHLMSLLYQDEMGPVACMNEPAAAWSGGERTTPAFA
jgi:DNA-directed RNA polymerase specialized sigma24 family protein